MVFDVFFTKDDLVHADLSSLIFAGLIVHWSKPGLISIKHSLIKTVQTSGVHRHILRGQRLISRHIDIFAGLIDLLKI